MLKTPSFLPNDDLLCFWDFQEPSGTPRRAQGQFCYELREAGAPVERVEGGIFGPFAARFEPGHSLFTPRAECPMLNFSGDNSQFTLVAWLKRKLSSYQGCQAVAGMWNEHGNRQYCLFLNLKIWESSEQIGAHVSRHGGATPGFPYCMDSAIGGTVIDFRKWHCAAISYDGCNAKVFLDGVLDGREPQGKAGRNPFLYPGTLHNGMADFTVGAVERPAKVVTSEDGTFLELGSVLANPFIGDLGGLAVYNRALSDAELHSLTIPIHAQPFTP